MKLLYFDDYKLGVLKGGNRVLFAVTPGTVVEGRGVCIPGPINCQVVSLAPDQVESVWRSTSTGLVPEKVPVEKPQMLS